MTKLVTYNSRPTSLWSDMDSLFDDFFGNAFTLAPIRNNTLSAATFSPRMDVVETESAYEISAELPGLTEKDIDISLSDGVLTLKGEKKTEHEDKGKHHHRIERRYGSFSHQMYVPENVDTTKVEAAFKHGVLTLTLPKAEKPEPEVQKIEIKG